MPFSLKFSTPLLLAVGLGTFLLPPAHAQAPVPETMPKADARLYRAFGEKPGLQRLMDDFMVRLLADARTAPHFKDSDIQRVKEQLVEQFCDVSGGPCTYRGADMRSAHANLDIRKADFNALVELLQVAMSAQGIAFVHQNRLLALLAPMHRDIINTR